MEFTAIDFIEKLHPDKRIEYDGTTHRVLAVLLFDFCVLVPGRK